MVGRHYKEAHEGTEPSKFPRFCRYTREICGCIASAHTVALRDRAAAVKCKINTNMKVMTDELGKFESRNTDYTVKAMPK